MNSLHAGMCEWFARGHNLIAGPLKPEALKSEDDS